MNLNATILGQTIAFVLFGLCCMKFVWPPLIAAIEKRQKDIAEHLAAAQCAKNSLEVSRIKAEECLQQAKVEAQAIIERTNTRKAQIIDEAKRIAKIERNKILAQAQEDINAEYKRTKEELRKKIATLIIAGVEKIIERSVDEASNSKIIDKVISEL